MIYSENTIFCRANKNIPIPEMPPVVRAASLSASDDTQMMWISSILSTGETKVIDGETYHKCILYVSANFNFSDGWEVSFKYSDDLTISPSQWPQAIHDGDTIEWDFSIGTSVDTASVPTYQGTEAVCTSKSYVYVPVSLTACYFIAALNESSSGFNKDLFIFKRKGDIKLDDKIVVGYGAVASENIVVKSLNPGSVDFDEATPVKTTVAISAAAVAARPYLKEAGDTETGIIEDGVYELS